MVNPQFILPSFAKINWSLRVLGKRPDGYHEVRTVLQTISLHDRLSFSLLENDKVLLKCNDASIPSGDDNLIVKAAAALKSHYGLRLGANIELDKQLPAQAGLGGASSNAAVTLLGLARLWSLEVNKEELVGIAAKLGADVPFFLVGGRALGAGIGTALKPLRDLDSQHLIVIAPRAKVETAVAYQSLQAPALTSTGSAPILAGSRDDADFCNSDQWQLQEQLQNDFERVIFDREPEIRRAYDELVRIGAQGVLLAGSGSSVFGIFGSLSAQQQAVQAIERESGWRIFSCVTMSRSDYWRELGHHESVGSF